MAKVLKTGPDQDNPSIALPSLDEIRKYGGGKKITRNVSASAVRIAHTVNVTLSVGDRLHGHFLMLPKTLTIDCVNNCLGAVDEVEQGVTYAADAQLPIGAWAQDFVHGADMTIAMHRLAEYLMEDDEGISQIDSLSFRNPVNTNLRFTVSTKSIDGPRPPVSATFTTTKGKKIFVSGMPLPRSSLALGQQNPIAKSMVCTCESCYPTPIDNVHTFWLKPDSKYDQYFDDYPELKISTVLDIFNTAFLSGILSQNKELKDNNLSLVLGVRDFILPPNTMFTADTKRGRPRVEITLPADLNDVQPGRNGFKVFLLHVRFFAQNDGNFGGGTIYCAFPDSERTGDDFVRRIK